MTVGIIKEPDRLRLELFFPVLSLEFREAFFEDGDRAVDPFRGNSVEERVLANEIFVRRRVLFFFSPNSVEKLFELLDRVSAVFFELFPVLPGFFVRGIPRHQKLRQVSPALLDRFPVALELPEALQG